MAELPKDMIFHYYSDDGITLKVDAIQLVRCGECKWWSEPVDEICGKIYGQCQRPISAINPTSLVNSKWYCADGERKDGADDGET